MKLSDIDIHRIGNEIQIVGVVYAGRSTDGGKEHEYIIPLPGEDVHVGHGDEIYLDMDLEDWERFLHQTDTQEVQTFQLWKEKGEAEAKVVKAIVRKGQRLVDTAVSWKVFARDGFRCRYCGAGDGTPMTYDHLICWESGGPWTMENGVSACKKCNRTRGQMKYADWLNDPYYKKVSRNLTEAQRAENIALIATLHKIPLVVNVRSR